MRVLFLTIGVVVIYRAIVDNIVLESAISIQVVAMLQYLGTLALVVVLCMSIRDTIKNMKKQEEI